MPVFDSLCSVLPFSPGAYYESDSDHEDRIPGLRGIVEESRSVTGHQHIDGLVQGRCHSSA